MAPSLKNNRGAVLIESLASVVLILFVLGFLGTISFIGLSQLTIRHLNHTAILEALENKSEQGLTDCYKKQIHNLYSFVKIRSWRIDLRQTTNQMYEVEGTILWQTQIGGLSYSGKDRQFVSEKRLRAMRL